MFVHVNPVQIHFHLDSCLWFNSFALNLHESLQRNSAIVNAAVADAQPPATASANAAAAPPGLMYMDVKFEAIMPRIVFECTGTADSAAATSAQRDRPKAMQVQISRLLCTNIRELGATRADLAQALHSLQEGSLVFASDFPTRPADLCVVTDRILAHVAAADVSASSVASTPLEPGSPPPSSTTSAAAAETPPGRYAFCAEPRDIWCMKLDPLWVDFLGARSVGQSKSVPFVDAVPITLWLHGNALSGGLGGGGNAASSSGTGDLNANPQRNNNAAADDRSSSSSASTSADLHVIAHIANMVSVQIDHFQYLFLLRLAEELTELSTFAALDADRIQKMAPDAADKPATSIVFGCVVPQLELTLVMPSQTPGKENSGCDAESMVPDSVSIGGDGDLVQLAHAVAASMSTSISQQQAAAKCNGDLSRAAASAALMTTSSTLNAAAAETPAQPPAATIDRPASVISRTDTLSPARPAATQQPVLSNTPTPTPSISMTGTSGGGHSRTQSRSTRGGSVADFGSSLLTMKKGFSNFMTSIDSALKSGPASAADDASDSFSIKSDISSDSDNFQLVLAGDDKTTDCMEVMFK